MIESGNGMGIIRRGILKGMETVWQLGKVIFPITLVMSLISHTALFNYIVHSLAPVMAILDLPGKAAVPLVLANFLNLYAGIGAMLTMSLSVKSVFILAVMMSFSHNLLIESGVAAKAGVKLWMIMAIRLGLALLAAVLLSLFWHGGTQTAHYGLIKSVDGAHVHTWSGIVVEAIKKAGLGILQLALIVMPLMVMIQFLKEKDWLRFVAKSMAPLTKLLGMEKNVATTLAAGFIFGLAYGAGVMIQAVQEDNVNKRSLYLAFIFLVGCHAVVEDTLIFVPLGIPVWPLLMMRFCVALIVTFIVSKVWTIFQMKHHKKRRKSA